jgi:outer membrane immunogenic protein
MRYLQSAGTLAGLALAMLATPAIAQDNTVPPGSSATPDMSAQSNATMPPPAPSSSDADMSGGGTSFRGIRIEGDVGGSRFASQGRHNDKLGYGATVGFDGQIGQRIVIGAEGSYWRANKWNQNCSGVSDGSVCQKSFEEWGAAVRAGYLLTPQFLVFGKGGYVNNEQRKRFDATTGTGATSYYEHFRTDGYQYGGGVEYDLTNMRFPVYLNVQYVRSLYNDNTHQDKLFAGIGLHFK